MIYYLTRGYIFYLKVMVFVYCSLVIGIVKFHHQRPILYAIESVREQLPYTEDQGPTSTRYSNRTRIFLYYSNPTRKVLKNDRVASSMYFSHFRKYMMFRGIQGPTSTRYSNRTRIFLYFSNPTRKFLKNDRVASSMYFSHFRKIVARPASQNYSLIDTDKILLFLI